MNLGQQHFYGHGKLLLTGEYLVLEGSKAIALPTNFGQKMHVNYRRSHDPKLFWKCFDYNSQLWFEAEFELWHFNLLGKEDEKSHFLQKILREARRQNVHFLRDDVDVIVNCHLEFGQEWGLGSSSTLIYNVAQWAYISAFELNRNVSSGSGYDVACAGAVGPIYYQLKNTVSSWGTADFDPLFKNQLYFVHLNKKQKTSDQITWFKNKVQGPEPGVVQAISDISDQVLRCYDLREFEELLLQHEHIISKLTQKRRIQAEFFSDYPGVIKSLGAWGGDFVLVTAPEAAALEYFKRKGLHTILEYDQMICKNRSAVGLPAELSFAGVHEFRA